MTIHPQTEPSLRWQSSQPQSGPLTVWPGSLESLTPHTTTQQNRSKGIMGSGPRRACSLISGAKLRTSLPPSRAPNHSAGRGTRPLRSATLSSSTSCSRRTRRWPDRPSQSTAPVASKVSHTLRHSTQAKYGATVAAAWGGLLVDVGSATPSYHVASHRLPAARCVRGPARSATLADAVGHRLRLKVVDEPAAQPRSSCSEHARAPVGASTKGTPESQSCRTISAVDGSPASTRRSSIFGGANGLAHLSEPLLGARRVARIESLPRRRRSKHLHHDRCGEQEYSTQASDSRAPSSRTACVDKYKVIVRHVAKLINTSARLGEVDRRRSRPRIGARRTSASHVRKESGARRRSTPPQGPVAWSTTAAAGPRPPSRTRRSNNRLRIQQRRRGSSVCRRTFATVRRTKARRPLAANPRRVAGQSAYRRWTSPARVAVKSPPMRQTVKHIRDRKTSPAGAKPGPCLSSRTTLESPRPWTTRFSGRTPGRGRAPTMTKIPSPSRGARNGGMVAEVEAPPIEDSLAEVEHPEWKTSSPRFDPLQWKTP